MKNLLITFIAISMLLMSRGEANAFKQASGASAQFDLMEVEQKTDDRAEMLASYLAERNSPLAPYAKDFVDSADRYDLDWRLVAAIAGLESSFGQRIPYNSYNAWGWGVYGDNVIRFSSWSEGIEVISKGLRERYLGDMETNVYVIGPTYASSPTWAVRVDYFMRSIETYRIKNAKSALSLAL
jgi:hypothetical protein